MQYLLRKGESRNVFRISARFFSDTSSSAAMTGKENIISIPKMGMTRNKRIGLQLFEITIFFAVLECSIRQVS
jgi:hypothetical protein